ncbi:MAG: hypothetical protein ABSH10_08515 [Phycisphaerae bacterium]|jgi:hypothetical protein
MGIQFQCEHCHREVQAPDEAGGKRGKCPFCHQSTYIPSPVAEEDLLPLADIDEEGERKARAEAEAMLERERGLRTRAGGSPPVPLEHRKDLATADLHHFVINFCLEMARDHVEAAELEADKLRQFGALGRKALEEIATGEVREPALEALARRARELYLDTLRDKLK